jgi:hypothetical protein
MLLSVGFACRSQPCLLSTGPIEHKAAFLERAHPRRGKGAPALCHRGDRILPARERGRIDAAASRYHTAKHSGEEALANEYLIRGKAADFGIPLITSACCS